MSQVTVSQNDLNRGAEMLNHLYKSSLVWVSIEVEDMTVDKARDIWSCLKPFLPGVAARSGTTAGRTKSLEVLRMLGWIEKKATGE